MLTSENVTHLNRRKRWRHRPDVHGLLKKAAEKTMA